MTDLNKEAEIAELTKLLEPLTDATKEQIFKRYHIEDGNINDLCKPERMHLLAELYSRKEGMDAWHAKSAATEQELAAKPARTPTTVQSYRHVPDHITNPPTTDCIGSIGTAQPANISTHVPEVNHISNHSHNSANNSAISTNKAQQNVTGSVSKMTTINVSGQAKFDNVKLKHEARIDAVIVRIKPAYDKEQTFTENGKKVTKNITRIPIEFEVKDGDTVKTIALIAPNKITKGSGSFSNSKMYDVLERANLLEDLIAKFGDKDMPTDQFLEYLTKNLVGRQCLVEISNTKRGLPEEHSFVGKIVEFKS